MGDEYTFDDKVLPCYNAGMRSMLQAKTEKKKFDGCAIEDVYKCVELRFKSRNDLMQCIETCDVQKFKSGAFKKKAKLDVEDVFAAYCYQIDYVFGGEDGGICLDQCNKGMALKPDCMGDLMNTQMDEYTFDDKVLPCYDAGMRSMLQAKTE